MRVAAWMLLGIGLAGGGRACCIRPGRTCRRYVVRLDQLVIHSDFDIPKRNPLLREVNALRGDVSKTLGLPTSKTPIDVYLFADASGFGRFIHGRFPQLPDRRAFFVESDGRLCVYAQWGEHVAIDLRHEVTHGYLHSMTSNLPLWLDEGLAEFFEVPRGQNGFHRVNLDDLMAATRQRRWQPDIRRLEAINSVADMGRTEYAEAWAWVHLLLETEPARRELLHSYLAGLHRGADAAPLSQRLRTAGLDNPQLLLDHIQKLAAANPPG